MRKKLILLVCMMTLALFSASMAVAYSFYTNDFNTEYGTDGTRGGSNLGSCITCHTGAEGGGLNPYGRDYNGSFTDIENIDSDGDKFSNIDEILVGTFPGDASSTPVSNNPPMANAAGPYNGTVDEPLQFIGSGSSDSDGSIVAYDWDFGDGNTGTGPTPSHTYTTGGTYNVTLTVTDDTGDTGTDTTTATIGIGNQAPTADANSPYNGTVNESVAFNGSGSSDPDGAIDAYDWDFGDGNTGTGPTPTHSYAAGGTYNVTLTVTDDMGAQDSDMATATIGLGNQAPIADANNPYNGTANEPVAFDGSGSTDPDGSIVAYDWDFGDGNTGTGEMTTHTYARDGSFTVTLTVTDDAGDTGTDTTTATIGPGNQPPIADANNPYNGTVNEPVAFDGSGSTDPDGSIVAYDWDFGDDSTGTGPTPLHTYTTDGTYNVTLTVTDNMGASDSTTRTATIGLGNQPPIADANNPYNGTVNEPVQFNGSGSSDPDGTIVAYDWDFGDDSTGTGPTPTHTYTTDGTYNVTLTVTDDMGASDSITRTATIGQDTQPPPDNPGEDNDEGEEEGKDEDDEGEVDDDEDKYESDDDESEKRHDRKRRNDGKRRYKRERKYDRDDD